MLCNKSRFQRCFSWPTVRHVEFPHALEFGEHFNADALPRPWFYMLLTWDFESLLFHTFILSAFTNEPLELLRPLEQTCL